MKNKTKKLKNPLNPTEQQRIYRNGLWAKALEANKRKARRSMRDGHGGRCCLQVAEDVAIECGLTIERSMSSDFEPPEQVAKFFGWDDTDPTLSHTDEYGGDYETDASQLNDCFYFSNKSLGMPHKEIAKIVRENFCKKNV